jgi:mono/diheme cytochrome c family protein
MGMPGRHLLSIAGSILVALLLGACGQGNSGDAPPAATPSAISGINGFLLFPNPQVQADGSLQTDTTAYAQAYYAAIDPTNAKDTLAKWKAANGFDTGTGTEATVVFGDARDLGFGRRMTMRKNVDGTIATVVENYQVTTVVNYGFTSLNVDAAVVRDQQWLQYVNTVEFSPGPGGGVSFVKFFNFNAVTGQRELTIDLDGRGAKAMPSACISCHGGRGDPLTPPDATGNPLFPLVANSVSQQRGDAQARLMPFEADSFQYSTTAGFTRADQEAALKIFNTMVLCSYPLPVATAFPEDACRRAATVNEWQGTAAALIKAAYGGDGLPNAAYSDTFVPTGWSSAGQTALYQSVVVPACRICHLVRGTGNQSDIDFNTYAKWLGHADRTKVHVIDRGNMPLAKIVFDTFWSTSMAETLAAFLQGQGFSVRDAAGTVLRPGRPVADPGPDRTIRQGATVLSAAGSLYSSSYSWSIVSGPNGATPPNNATLTNPNTVQPTFNATADGTYVLQLVTGNGATQSAPAQVALVVNNALAPAPSTIRFSDIKNAVQTLGCTGCHTPGGPPPVLFANIDRNGDGIAGDATDDLWFYTELRGRINFTDLVASPLLRKPSGKHHGGGLRPGFDTTAVPGQAARTNYDLFLNWILNGAPQ